MIKNTMTKQLCQPFLVVAEKMRHLIYSEDLRKCLLSALFLRYLSDNYEKAAKKELGSCYPVLSNKPLETWYNENPDDIALFEKRMCRKIHYVIQPQHLWVKMVERAKREDKDLAKALQACFECIEQQSFEWSLQGIFSEMRLLSFSQGQSMTQGNNVLCKIIMKIDKALEQFSTDSDIFCEAFEALLEKFSHDFRKDFHTPQCIANLLSAIVTLDGQEPARGMRKGFPRVLDFACGSGSLLLNVRKKLGIQGVGKMFGQEVDSATYQVARMNMLLHGVKNSECEIFRGDTLLNEWDRLCEVNPARRPFFDIVVSVPPFTARWVAANGVSDDARFKDFGVPPQSCADAGFLLHGLHFLKQDGVMAIVLHHGILFREGVEKQIRMNLVENNHIDAVIELPYDLFYSTGIAVCIVILKKCKQVDDILFVNACSDYEKGNRQNHILPEHIEKMVATYQFRQEEDRYSKRVSRDEIRKKSYSMKISSYILME